MNADTIADRIIVELVRVQDHSPALLSEVGWGLDIWDLVVRASLLSREETRMRRGRCLAGAVDEIPAIQTLMVNRGWVSARSPGPHDHSAPGLYPTSAGIDYAHGLARPWVRKALVSLRESQARKTVVPVRESPARKTVGSLRENQARKTAGYLRENQARKTVGSLRESQARKTVGSLWKNVKVVTICVATSAVTTVVTYFVLSRLESP